jgi:hypothetical protein
MSESHTDRGASRLFHTIIVVGAFGAVACGGTVTETSPDGEPTASGGTPSGMGGGPGSGGIGTGGALVGTGGLPQNTGGIVLGTGGTVACGGASTGGVFGVGGASPETCLEWDDFVCADETTTLCWCDPSQPDAQEDCAPSTYLLWSYPLSRTCVPAVAGPEACEYRAQYSQTYVEELASTVNICDPHAPLVECDCPEGTFSCQSYDPPTSCFCFVGILK